MPLPQKENSKISTVNVTKIEILINMLLFLTIFFRGRRNI